MASPAEDRSEIVFFDVETTVPTRPGQGRAILEFGAILVCPRTLTERHSYSTLVRPANLFLISPSFDRRNGINFDAVSSAPTFADIADTVYDLLHRLYHFSASLLGNGRIWAGHNILRFDCDRIRDAFKEISGPAPEPKSYIDSLVLLTQRFGTRAGDMKMASLATYFGLGQQTHRSLDDVRMNLEVLKHCATVLFLESLPESAVLEPDEISIPSISASLVPLNCGRPRIELLHEGVPFQLCGTRLMVRFGIRTKFFYHAGRPRLSFVVDSPPSLCEVIDACDSTAYSLSLASGRISVWCPVVTRKYNNPALRLHIPTAVCGNDARDATEIYQEESSGTIQRRLFSKFEAAELSSLFIPGTFVDAIFSLDPYDYQQQAGIKLVAKKLIIHSNLKEDGILSVG